MKRKVLTIVFVIFVMATLFIIFRYAHVIWYAIIWLLILFVDQCTNEYLTKPEIFEVVNTNYSIILNDIENDNFEKTLNIKGIENVDEEKHIIEFQCGTEGFSSETTDYGFYYTSDDMPYCFVSIWTNHEKKEELLKDGDGFLAKQKDGDDYFYTEKIRDNFYYYEMHY